jgi:hypothetical protein
VYLDVWERHITCVEDPHIREVALGGPDTTTRAQVVWQVRSGRPRGSQGPDISGIPPRSGTGRLRAYAGPGAGPSPCVIAPSSSYRGPENQLYRVEIHDPGVAGRRRSSGRVKTVRSCFQSSATCKSATAHRAAR